MDATEGRFDMTVWDGADGGWDVAVAETAQGNASLTSILKLERDAPTRLIRQELP